jgi:hypothetical protein
MFLLTRVDVHSQSCPMTVHTSYTSLPLLFRAVERRANIVSTTSAPDHVRDADIQHDAKPDTILSIVPRSILMTSYVERVGAYGFLSPPSPPPPPRLAGKDPPAPYYSSGDPRVRTSGPPRRITYAEHSDDIRFSDSQRPYWAGERGAYNGPAPAPAPYTPYASYKSDDESSESSDDSSDVDLESVDRPGTYTFSLVRGGVSDGDPKAAEDGSSSVPEDGPQTRSAEPAERSGPFFERPVTVYHICQSQYTGAGLADDVHSVRLAVADGVQGAARPLFRWM